jgi:hypothetical protein
MTAPRSSPGDVDRQAHDLYRRYGAAPWAELPEATRKHFRSLVSAGIDGQGQPLGRSTRGRTARTGGCC